MNVTPIALDPRKFRDPQTTAKGDKRAAVTLTRLDTLWFNTGTLCNIECVSCYIESSPSNNRLAYLSLADVGGYLDEIADLGLGTREIGFTGGEPFLNPNFPDILETTLERGFEVLVLTNAMRPMQRPAVKTCLLELRARHHERLVLRVSLDHYTRVYHDAERGAGSWRDTLAGLRWLCDNGFRVAVAGRTCWGQTEDAARAGYKHLFATRGMPLDGDNPTDLVLFPELDEAVDVPEITVDCWGILGIDPASMMCATSRMIVKRKGAAAPAVVTCTLVPYDRAFESGPRLADALGPVLLNHPHCAKFCVLGGASCSRNPA